MCGGYYIFILGWNLEIVPKCTLRPCAVLLAESGIFKPHRLKLVVVFKERPETSCFYWNNSVLFPGKKLQFHFVSEQEA